MTPTDTKSPTTRQNARVPIETRVHLEFEKFSGFITEYSSNISEGGIFIRTNDPKPLGTVLSFEFKLADNFKLIQGLGEVVWARTEDLSPERPAGMGIRFVDIDPQSRELISTMVHNYVKRGGEPFQLEATGEARTAKAEVPAFSLEETPEKTTPPPEKGLDPRDLFAMADDVAEPSLTSDADRSLEPSAASPVEADFQALFEASDEAVSIPNTQPEILLPPEPRKAPHGNKVIDLGMVIEDDAISGSAVSAPIVDLLEPERPAKKRTPTLKRRKALKISAPMGAAIAVVLGVGSAVFFQSQITRFVLGIFGSGNEKKLAAHKNVPDVRPSAIPTTALKAVSTPGTTPVPTLVATATQAPQPTPQTTVAPAPTTSPPVEKLAPTTAQATATFGSIQKISWEKTTAGLILILTADNVIPSGSWTHTRVDEGSAREVIKFIGVRKPFPSRKLTVNTPEVLRVRVGFHASPAGNELHIVADLGDPAVRVTRMEPDGRNLRVHFGK